MTDDKSKLNELLEKVKNLPEGEELPEDILADLSQEEILAIYIEKMILDKGVEPTDELRSQLLEEIEDDITKALVSAMPSELVDKLNNDIDNGASDDALEAAINESGIDVEKITNDTMNAFRDKYLGEEK